MKEQMASKPPGLAYMYKQKLENIVKGELDTLMDAYFKNFYEKIKGASDEIKVEKVKKADDCMVMMMNLSGLARDEKALGSVLDEIESEEGIKIHFTGPWQPYSFI
jgi:phosphoglucomutase